MERCDLCGATNTNGLLCLDCQSDVHDDAQDAEDEDLLPWPGDAGDLLRFQAVHDGDRWRVWDRELEDLLPEDWGTQREAAAQAAALSFCPYRYSAGGVLEAAGIAGAEASEMIRAIIENPGELVDQLRANPRLSLPVLDPASVLAASALRARTTRLERSLGEVAKGRRRMAVLSA